MRRPLLAVAVVATLVLAGCATGGIGDGPTDAEDGAGDDADLLAAKRDEGETDPAVDVPGARTAVP